jgi:hypothetical protein
MGAMTMESKRGGASTDYWSGSGSEPKLYFTDSARKDIQFRFTIPSKGGGDTNCMVRVPSEDFDSVARAMAKADREEGPYNIAKAMLDVGFDKAVEAFERAKQEWIDQEKRRLEHRREMATERGRRRAAEVADSA